MNIPEGVPLIGTGIYSFARVHEYTRKRVDKRAEMC